MGKFTEPKVGELRNHVHLQVATKTPDGLGGYTVSWADMTDPNGQVIDPWARVTAWKGQEPYTDGQVNTSQWWEITMRYRPGITPDMRIVDLALPDTYNIRSAQDPDRRKRWIYLLCEALKQNET